MAGASEVCAALSLALEILEGPGDNTTVSSGLGSACSRFGWVSSCFAGGAGVVSFAGGCTLAEAGAGAAGVPGELDVSSAGCGAAAGLRNTNESSTAVATNSAAAAPTMRTFMPTLFLRAAAALYVSNIGRKSVLDSFCWSRLFVSFL